MSPDTDIRKFTHDEYVSIVSNQRQSWAYLHHPESKDEEDETLTNIYVTSIG